MGTSQPPGNLRGQAGTRKRIGYLVLQTDGRGRVEPMGHQVGSHDDSTTKAVEQEQLTRRRVSDAEPSCGVRGFKSRSAGLR